MYRCRFFKLLSSINADNFYSESLKIIVMYIFIYSLVIYFVTTNNQEIVQFDTSVRDVLWK